MIVVLFLIISIWLCYKTPWWIGAIIFMLNLFIPDPIPYVDEILSIPGPIKNMIKTVKAGRTLKKIADND